MSKAKAKEPFDKETLRKQYEEIYPKYEKLAEQLKEDISGFLKDADIDVLSVSCRIKEFESFWGKIERKGYENPFKEIEDVCGLRIVCYFPSDLPKISEIINREFVVKESIDKSAELGPDRFGYRSLHFVLTVKEDWLKAPTYRGLGGLKFEVQVRTVLTHAWADIEHKLQYKKEEDVPIEFRRKFSQLMALIEIADERFDELRQARGEYVASLVKENRFDVNQPMNIDSLQAFLDFYFSDREKTPERIKEFLDEITRFKVTIKELVEGYEKTIDLIPLAEIEHFVDAKRTLRFTQISAARMILQLTNAEYLKAQKAGFRKGWYEKVMEWKDSLKKRTVR